MSRLESNPSGAVNPPEPEANPATGADAAPPRRLVSVQYEQLEELRRRQRGLEGCVRSFISVQERIAVCEELDRLINEIARSKVSATSKRQLWSSLEQCVDRIVSPRRIKGLLEVDQSLIELVAAFDHELDRAKAIVRSMVRPGQSPDSSTSLFKLSEAGDAMLDAGREVRETCKERAQEGLDGIEQLIGGILIRIQTLEESSEGITRDLALSERVAPSGMPQPLSEETRGREVQAIPAGPSDRQPIEATRDVPVKESTGKGGSDV